MNRYKLILHFRWKNTAEIQLRRLVKCYETRNAFPTNLEILKRFRNTYDRYKKYLYEPITDTHKSQFGIRKRTSKSKNAINGRRLRPGAARTYDRSENSENRAHANSDFPRAFHSLDTAEGFPADAGIDRSRSCEGKVGKLTRFDDFPRRNESAAFGNVHRVDRLRGRVFGV